MSSLLLAVLVIALAITTNAVVRLENYRYANFVGFCSHHVEICADRWHDHVRLPDRQPRSFCYSRRRCERHPDKAASPLEEPKRNSLIEAR